MENKELRQELWNKYYKEQRKKQLTFMMPIVSWDSWKILGIKYIRVHDMKVIEGN